MKKELNKGVTLIALIITIIVLLILAGVTLAMVMGENGIFAKAQNAKSSTNRAQEDEKAKLAALENKLNGDDSSNPREIDETDYNNLKSKVNGIGEIFNGTVVTNTMGGSDSTTKVNQFTVTKKGNYVINVNLNMNWETCCAIGCFIYLNNEYASGNTYSNNLIYHAAPMNLTLIKPLNVGDVVDVRVYQFNNGNAGVNNLNQNELQLIKIGD